MSNFKTRPMSDDEFKIIVTTLKNGFVRTDGTKSYPKPAAAMCIVLIANLGLRIGDACRLRLTDITNERGRYIMRVKEQKTGKLREQTVQAEFMTYIQQYMLEMGKKHSEKIVGVGVRAVQQYLKDTVEYLGLEGIGSHSARKMFSISLYENTGSIEAVRQVLNHSTIAVSQAYISVKPELIEEALSNHVKLI